MCLGICLKRIDTKKMERDKSGECDEACGCEGGGRGVRETEEGSECRAREGLRRLDYLEDQVDGEAQQCDPERPCKCFGAEEGQCTCGSSHFETGMPCRNGGGQYDGTPGKRCSCACTVADHEEANKREPSVENMATTAAAGLGGRLTEAAGSRWAAGVKAGAMPLDRETQAKSHALGIQSIAEKQANQQRVDMEDSTARRADDGLSSAMPQGQIMHQGSTGGPGTRQQCTSNRPGSGVSHHHSGVLSISRCVSSGQTATPGLTGHMWSGPTVQATTGSRNPVGSQDSAHVPGQQPGVASPGLMVHSGGPLVGYPSTMAHPVQHAWNASGAPVPGQMVHMTAGPHNPDPQQPWCTTAVAINAQQGQPGQKGANHFLGVSHGMGIHSAQGVPATAAAMVMPSPVRANGPIATLNAAPDTTGMAPPPPPPQGGGHDRSNLNAFGGYTNRRVPRTVYPFMPGAPWAQGQENAAYGEGSGMVVPAAAHGVPSDGMQWVVGAQGEVCMPNSLHKGPMPAIGLSSGQGVAPSAYQRQQQQQTSLPVVDAIPMNGIGMAAPIVAPEGQGGVLVPGFPARSGHCFVSDQTQMGSTAFRLMADEDRMDGGPGEIITHDDYKFKGGGVKDQKRLKRMLSNRASAKRSRQRRMQRLEELESQADDLRVENATLVRKNSHATEKLADYLEENQRLQSEIVALRQELEKRRAAQCSKGDVESTSQGMTATSLSMEGTAAGVSEEVGERSLNIDAATSDSCEGSSGLPNTDVDDEQDQPPVSARSGDGMASSCRSGDQSR
ncbi:hypothetical protein CBR_g23827 [Chara braunii]|uniref:BZIP domain-containing protein n=1 Tax=Chara braunii TaxID=69332 RepID=A0A388JVR8_CHABU|nr:hypothetical protein CBR_g23827 [Chara braunii]|eukprot:GBG61875.1 hypothetical protein CBR_g23827 [Chara braunii]